MLHAPFGAKLLKSSLFRAQAVFLFVVILSGVASVSVSDSPSRTSTFSPEDSASKTDASASASGSRTTSSSQSETLTAGTLSPTYSLTTSFVRTASASSSFVNSASDTSSHSHSKSSSLTSSRTFLNSNSESATLSAPTSSKWGTESQSDSGTYTASATSSTSASGSVSSTHSITESSSVPSPSSTVSRTRSSVGRAPYIVAVDGLSSPSEYRLLVLPLDGNTSAVLDLQSTDGQPTSVTLSIVPTPADGSTSPWSQAMCSDGLPSISNTTVVLPSTGGSSVTVALAYADVAPLVALGGTNRFLLCTSDGFSAGILLQVVPVLVQPTPMVSITVPATSGQFRVWSFPFVVYCNSTGAASWFLDGLPGSSGGGAATFGGTALYAVDDGAQACASCCPLKHALATFELVAVNQSAATATIRSADLDTVPTSASLVLRLCVGGSPFLGGVIRLLRSVSLNGGVLNNASVPQLLVAAHSVVSPLQIAHVGSLSFVSRIGVTPCASQGTVNLTPLSSSATGTFTMRLGDTPPGAFTLCLTTTDANPVSALFVLANVSVVNVTSLDGVLAGPEASPSIVLLMFGASAPTIALTWGHDAFGITATLISSGGSGNTGNVFVGNRTAAYHDSELQVIGPSSVSMTLLSHNSTATTLTTATSLNATWGTSLAGSTTTPLAFSWQTLTTTATTPVGVELLAFSCVVVYLTSVARSTEPLSSRSVFLASESSTALELSALPSIASLTSLVADAQLGLTTASGQCSALASLSASTPTVSIAASSSLAAGSVFGVSPNAYGVFCLRRASQATFAQPADLASRFSLVTFRSLGSTTTVAQAIRPTSSATMGSANALRLSATLSSLDVLDGVHITVIPCNSPFYSALLSFQLYNDTTTSGGPATLAYWWNAVDTSSNASVVLPLCWTATNASVSSASEYFTNGAQVLAINASLLVSPPVYNDASDFILLAGATLQQFPLTMAAALAPLASGSASGLVLAVSLIDATSQQCNTTLPLLSTAYSTRIYTNQTALTTWRAVMPGTLSPTGALEPRATICFGFVNTTTTAAVSVWLPFVAGTATLVRYNITTHVDGNVSLFSSSSGTASTVRLVDYVTSTMGITYAGAGASAFLSSTGTSGLTLTMSLASSTTCANILYNVSVWSPSGSALLNDSALALNISTVPSDGLALCVLISSANAPGRAYSYAKVTVKVLRVSSVASLNPDTYYTAAEVTAASSSSLQALGLLSNSARTLAVSGQNLDQCVAWIVLFFETAGADCRSDIPDISAVATQIGATSIEFTIAAISNAAVYETVCLVGNVPSVMLYLHMAVRVSALASIGLRGTTQAQQGLIAVVGYPITVDLYSSSGTANVDTTAFLMFASNASSCGRGTTAAEMAAVFYSLPVGTSGSSGRSVVSLSGLTSAGTYYLCYQSTVATTSGGAGRRMRELATGVTMPLGIALTTIDAAIQSSYSLGSNATIGALVNKTLVLKITGSFVDSASVYIAATDTACDASLLTGTTVYGNSRVPVLFSSCAGGTLSATLPAATSTTPIDGPMTLCMALASTSDTVPSTSSLSFFNSSLMYAINQPDTLYVIQNQSSAVSTLGTLSVQPAIGMLDGASGVPLAVVPTSTVIVAQWYAVSPVQELNSESASYTLTSSDGDSGFFFSNVQLRNARFGYEYVLSFSIPASSGVATVNSSTTSVQSCTSNTQWAKWYTSTCTTCPTHALCDGTSSLRTDGSYWRPSAYSTNFYSCMSPYMDNTCESNTTLGTCVAGHSGPRCSVCLPGYGKASDYCVSCAGSTVQNAFIVIFAALAMVLVLVVLVLSTLQCKKSDQFPIYIKILLNHLTVSSTLGEFSQYLSSSLTTLFKIQQQASRPSPAFAALDCTVGLSWYQQFIVVVAFPAAAALALILFFNIRRLLQTLKTMHKNSRQVGDSAGGSSALVAQSSRDFLKTTSMAAVIAKRKRKTMFLDSETFGPLHESHQPPKEDSSGNWPESGNEGDRDASMGATAAAADGSGAQPSHSHSAATPRRGSKPSLRVRRKSTTNSTDRVTFGSVTDGVGPIPALAGDHSSDYFAQQGNDAPAAVPAPAPDVDDDDKVDSDEPGAVPQEARRSPRVSEIGGGAAASGGGGGAPQSGSDGSASQVIVAVDEHGADLRDSRSGVEAGTVAIHVADGEPTDAALTLRKQSTGATLNEDEEQDDEENENDAAVDVDGSTSAKALAKRRMTQDLGILEIHGAVARQEAIHLFGVVMVIVMFTVYPSIIQWCANVLYCEDIDYGEAQYDGSVSVDVRSTFFYDRAQLCTSDEHRRYQLVGFVLGFVYGFGTPLFAVILYIRLRRPKSAGGVGYVDASRMFTFLIAGYRKEVWWWEAAVMFRKLVLIYIVSFLRDAEQQTLCAFWIICLYFLAHVLVRPYEYEMVDRMERVSLVVICLTLNFSLAYPWVSGDTVGERIGYWALSIFLFVINVAIMVWMVKEIVVEGALKVRKLIFAMSDVIEEHLPAALAECVISLGYKPPEMIEVTADGEVYDVPLGGKLTAEEQRMFLDAEESGSDWSDHEEEFHLDDGDPVVDVPTGGTSDALGAAGNNSTAQSRASFAIEDDMQQLPQQPSQVMGAAGSSTSRWGPLHTKLRSFVALQRARSSGSGRRGVTADAQHTLDELNEAFQARSENVVTNLRAIIDGMESHSDGLIEKYAELKAQLKQREAELRAARCEATKHSAESTNCDAQIREHAARLVELQEMAAMLRDENESLKEELQRLTKYDRSLSPTNHLRLVEALEAERQQLLQQLARRDQEHGVGGGAEAPVGATPPRSAVAGAGGSVASGAVDDTVHQITAEAEAQRQAALALQQAERDAQMAAIQEQLRAKRENKQRRLEASGLLPAPPPGPATASVRRQSHVGDLVQGVVNDGRDEAASPTNPFTSTFNPRDSVQYQQRLTEMRATPVQELVREATENSYANFRPGTGSLQQRPGTGNRPGTGSQARRGTSAFVALGRSGDDSLASVLTDNQYQSVSTSDPQRVLLIKRRHPKMRAPEFLAPWGHPTWQQK